MRDARSGPTTTARVTIVLAAALALVGAACGPGRPGPDGRPADLVLLGGRVVPVDPDVPEGTALAVRDGRVLAVGDDEDVRALAGPSTRVVDLAGRLAVPGFIEAHGHFLGLGRQSLILDLRSARSWDEIVAQVAEAANAAPPGAWIVGRGWHQEKWDAPPAETHEGFPTRDSIDAVAGDHPVALEHASGHATLAGTRALEAAGIDDRTPDPAGGRIARDARGRATGILHETAAGLVEVAIERSRGDRPAERVREETARIAEAAARACVENGVTSFQDAGASLDEVALFREMAADGRLAVRLWVMLGEPDEAIADRLDEVRTIGADDGFVTVRAIKRYADGALGNRGAWLLAPYDDASDSTGIPTTTPEALAASARLALDHGYQLCVHAIGDRANREVLDVYERTVPAERLRESRWRIEHAQHLDPADVPRFGRLGVIASMQAVHCTSDGPWVPLRIGDRRAADGAYVWRSLLDAGAVVANGTDVPVEAIDPIANFHAAVTRRMRDGAAFHPEQAMTREEALRAATLDAAFAAFEEDVKGSLTPGKFADVAVLTRDILRVPEDDIPGTRIVMTVVGGRVAFDATAREE